jgi:hypothetical protein
LHSPNVAKGKRQLGLPLRARRHRLPGREADKRPSPPPETQVFRRPGAGYLSRKAICESYGISHQRLNGWRVRAGRALPAPVRWRGQPYWNLWRLVAWEVASLKAKRSAV